LFKLFCVHLVMDRLIVNGNWLMVMFFLLFAICCSLFTFLSSPASVLYYLNRKIYDNGE
jgi:hypothetical protein